MTEELFAVDHLLDSAILIRHAPGSRNAYGEWVEGAETVTDIQVVSQPGASGRDRDMVPEGIRETDIRSFIIPVDVLPVEEDGSEQTGPDLIEYNGERFEIMTSSDWRDAVDTGAEHVSGIGIRRKDRSAIIADGKTRQLERALRQWVALGSNLASSAVIPGNDNGPAPVDTYATVLSIGPETDDISNNTYRQLGGGQLQTVEAVPVTHAFSVQWFRDNGTDRARMFRAWSRSPQGTLESERRGFVLTMVSSIRQLDALISDAWEERAGADLTIGYWDVYMGDVGTIDRAPVSINDAPTVIITS